MTMLPDLVIGGAIFGGPDGEYRYSLTRAWGEALDDDPATTSRIMFVMLNPSTADATVNDPTVRRCLGFAMKWGYNKLTVCNLFAYRTTRPVHLTEQADPVGPDNDDWIGSSALGAVVVAAWGAFGGYLDRDEKVLALLAADTVFCLRETSAGYPSHPLYLPKDLDLNVYRGAHGR